MYWWPVMNKNKLQPVNANCIRLIQITDTHIFSDPEEELDGLNTATSLSGVIEAIAAEEQADLVVLSGDLVHDPSPSAYANLSKLLERLTVPVFCLPGNHDDPGLMQKQLNSGITSTDKEISIGNWRLILLDDFIPNTHTHAGALGKDELAFLDNALEQSGPDNVIIFLHHQPVPVLSSWMDGMMLENPEDFFSIVDCYSQVRCIAWGHVHQEFRSSRAGVSLVGSPSTCIQFTPGSDAYARDNLDPGYTVFELSPGGGVEVQVKRVG